jgi:hypothetical protein
MGREFARPRFAAALQHLHTAGAGFAEERFCQLSRHGAHVLVTLSKSEQGT